MSDCPGALVKTVRVSDVEVGLNVGRIGGRL